MGRTSQNVRLGLRLRAVAELVPPGSRVADIGADHGELARCLMLRGRAAHCIATEATPARLPVFAPTDGVETRVGAGLEPLRPNDRLDVLVLAGMGARTIRKILDSPRLPRLGATRLVLQPQTELAGVRRWLVDRGLSIVEERLVVDRGRRYVALAAEPSDSPIPRLAGLDLDDLLDVGPCLVRSGDPLVRLEWEQRLEYWRRLVDRAAGTRGAATAGLQVARARRVLGVLDALL